MAKVGGAIDRVEIPVGRFLPPKNARQMIVAEHLVPGGQQGEERRLRLSRRGLARSLVERPRGRLIAQPRLNEQAGGGGGVQPRELGRPCEGSKGNVTIFPTHLLAQGGPPAPGYAERCIQAFGRSGSNPMKDLDSRIPDTDIGCHKPKLSKPP